MALRIYAVACACSIALAGCADFSTRWENRYGPNPVLQPEAIGKISDRQVAVLKTLGDKVPVNWPPAAANDWYNVTLLGFNAVDDACAEYLENIFMLDREKNRVKDTLAAAGATTAAVLSATDASKQAMSIVAQGFGFSSALTGILADSYLYKLSPSTIYGIEKKLQDAYRGEAAKAKSQIDNGATSYLYIRGYLSLCLAPTIESKIEEYLAQTIGASATTKPVGAAPAVSLAPM